MGYSNFATTDDEVIWQGLWTASSQKARAMAPGLCTFGDSITQIQPWEAINGQPYLSCGLGGAGAADVANTFGAPAFSILQPTGAILMIGLNDTAYNLGGQQVLQWEAGFTTFIKACATAGIPLALTTILPIAAGSSIANGYASRNPIIKIFNNMIKAYGTTYNLPVYDTWAAIPLDANGNALAANFQMDYGYHPNAAGFALLKPLYDQAAAALTNTLQTMVKKV